MTTRYLEPTCLFGRPQPAHGEPDGAAAPVALASPAQQDPLTAFPAIPDAPGDEGPQWGDLEKKYGDEPKGTETIPPAEPPKTKPKAEPVAKEEEKPEAKPDKPEGDKKPDKPPEATPPAELPKAEPKPLDPDQALKDADALQIKPNASTATKEGFENLRAITKQAVGEVKELRQKLAEATAAAGKLPEPLEKELSELREFKEVWGAENDPVFEAQYKERLGEAEEKLLKTLVEDPALLLPKKDADALKAAGFDSEAGIGMINNILGTVQKTGNHLLYERVRDMVVARNRVLDERGAKLEELKGKQGSFLAARAEKEKADHANWAKGVNARMVELFEEAEWGHYKEIKEGDTAEARAAAEAHNKQLKEVVVPAIHEALGAGYARDPDKLAELVFRSFALGEVEKERDGLKQEVERATARVAELEKTAAGVRRVSAPSARDAAPITPPGAPAGDMDAEQAVDAFLAGRKK